MIELNSLLTESVIAMLEESKLVEFLESRIKSHKEYLVFQNESTFPCKEEIDKTKGKIAEDKALIEIVRSELKEPFFVKE